MSGNTNLYSEKIKQLNNSGHAFSLIQITEYIYAGIDSYGKAVIVCKSNSKSTQQIRQKKKKLTLECNMCIQFEIERKKVSTIAHIIKCDYSSEKEREIFFDLCPIFIEASTSENQVETLLETVSVLASFFANTNEPSDNELQGLFAELYAMLEYKSDFDLAYYWQSRQRMTFDFSINDKYKIEVKSTIKNERKHHFRHEQLRDDPYTVYVLSYMMRHDDQGLSLFDLIKSVRPLLLHDVRKLMAIDKILKNTSDERLKEFRFNVDYINQKKALFRAKDIPKFDGPAPNGVTNTEYDCNLDTAPQLDRAIFIKEIKDIIDGDV